MCDVLKPSFDESYDRACKSAERLGDDTKLALAKIKKRAVDDGNSTKQKSGSARDKTEDTFRDTGDSIKIPGQEVKENAQEISDVIKLDSNDAAKDLYKNFKDRVPGK